MVHYIIRVWKSGRFAWKLTAKSATFYVDEPLQGGDSYLPQATDDFHLTEAASMSLNLPVKSGKEKRLTELILYISKKLSNDEYFGQVKLNKVVFFSDFTAYGRL